MDEKKEVKTEATAEANVENPKAKIENDPIEFDVDATTMFCNGYQLTEKIDAMFKAVFVDYIGCEILVNNGNGALQQAVNQTVIPGNLYVNLKFRDIDADGFHMLHRIAAAEKSNILGRVQRTFGAFSSRAYSADPDALEALEELLPVHGNAKIKWDNRYFENQSMAQPGMLPVGFNVGSYIYAELVGFPIELILKKLFGGKDENGKDIDYACHIMRTTVDGRTYVFQISKMSRTAVDKLCSVIGVGQTNYISNVPYFSYPAYPQPVQGYAAG